MTLEAEAAFAAMEQLLSNAAKMSHLSISTETQCWFLYWDVVGYVTKPVYCLTLSCGGRADSDFGQQKASKQNFIRVSIQIIAQTYTYDR